MKRTHRAWRAGARSALSALALGALSALPAAAQIPPAPPPPAPPPPAPAPPAPPPPAPPPPAPPPPAPPPPAPEPPAPEPAAAEPPAAEPIPTEPGAAESAAPDPAPALPPAGVALAPAATEPGAATPATAPVQPAEPPVPPLSGLQSPEQVSTRYSAYSLPRGMWALDIGAFGISGGDAFAKIGAAYGLGGGVQLEVNLAHMGLGLLNLSANWQFVDTRYFDLGASIGVWYGHGEWFWIARGAAKTIASKIDVVSIPVAVTASAPLTDWLQLDLALQYTYGDIYGATTADISLFEDAEIGLRQLFFRPGAHLYISDNTSFDLSAKLPVYTDLPRDRAETELPFSRTWTLELGLRSRLTPGVFGNLRLHYGDVGDALYDAPLFPSFDVEFRL
jgi:hypothetical protein